MPKKSSQSGVVAIETALGMVAFLVMIGYWIEVSYMGFVSALVDYTVAETSRSARTTDNTDYREKVRQLLDDSDSLWAVFVDPDRLSLQVHYYDTVADLGRRCADDKPFCGQVAKTFAPLAVYRVSYSYRPLFISFFPSLKSMAISREAIAVQEYERFGL